MTDRPAIPAAMKRQVRQECRFGCVICGMPVFQYDHILEYADARQHAVENLALLCPNHHQDKTSGRLDIATVAEWRVHPFNMVRGFTTGHQLAPARRFNAILGSNTGWKDFSPEGGEYAILWVNGEGLLVIHAEGGWLSFSMRLTDNAGDRLLIIDRGELSVSTAQWDYDYQGVALKIRRAQRVVFLDMELASSRVYVKQGAFMNQGAGFLVEGEELSTVANGCRGMVMVGCSSDNNQYGGWGISTNGVQPPGPFGFFMG